MESDAVLQFQALGFDPELGLPWAVFSVGFLEFFGFSLQKYACMWIGDSKYTCLCVCINK